MRSSQQEPVGIHRVGHALVQRFRIAPRTPSKSPAKHFLHTTSSPALLSPQTRVYSPSPNSNQQRPKFGLAGGHTGSSGAPPVLDSGHSVSGIFRTASNESTGSFDVSNTVGIFRVASNDSTGSFCDRTVASSPRFVYKRFPVQSSMDGQRGGESAVRTIASPSRRLLVFQPPARPASTFAVASMTRPKVGVNIGGDSDERMTPFHLQIKTPTSCDNSTTLPIFAEQRSQSHEPRQLQYGHGRGTGIVFSPVLPKTKIVKHSQRVFPYVPPT